MNERTMKRFYGPSGYVPLVEASLTNHELTREPRITLDEITVLQTELMRFASSNFHGMRDWYVKISGALSSQGFDNVDLARERDEYKRKYGQARDEVARRFSDGGQMYDKLLEARQEIADMSKAIADLTRKLAEAAPKEVI